MGGCLLSLPGALADPSGGVAEGSTLNSFECLGFILESPSSPAVVKQLCVLRNRSESKQSQCSLFSREHRVYWF